MKVSTYETGATRPVCCSCDPEWECGFWEVVGDRFKPCPGKVFGSDLAAWPREVRSPWLRAPTKPTFGMWKNGSKLRAGSSPRQSFRRWRCQETARKQFWDMGGGLVFLTSACARWPSSCRCLRSE